MRRTLTVLAICAVASSALAECPTEETIYAFGRTWKRGGFLGTLRDDPADCDGHNQPAWIAKINETAPTGAASANATPPALSYCRQVVKSKDPQYDSQHRDCIFWYGHSIEAQ